MTKQVVTIECDVPDGYEVVRYGYPNHGESFWWQGRLHTAAFNFEKDPHLIVRKLPPRLVPLAAKDVIAGKTILKAPWFSEGGGGTAISSVHPMRVGFLCAVTTGDDSEYRTYRKTWLELMREGWTYSNDHGATWQPCSKPEGAVS